MKGGPDFLILGVGRCGTSFLFRSATKQPEVVRCQNNKKEIRFFHEHYDAGIAWYRKFFPHAAGISGEATPSYLFHPDAPNRIKTHFPKVRMAVLFREPVARLWSHWRHLRYPGEYHAPFTEEWFETVVQRDYEKIQKEGLPDYLNKSHQYIGWGCYSHYLPRWFKVFPREQIRCYFSEDLYGKSREILADFFSFIGCTKTEITDELLKSSHHKSKFKPERSMSKEFKQKMQDFYRPYNEQFVKLLGVQLPKAWQY